MLARKWQCFSLFPLDKLKSRKKKAKLFIKGEVRLKVDDYQLSWRVMAISGDFSGIFEKKAPSDKPNYPYLLLGGGFGVRKCLDFCRLS
ncbi:MAG: hypothetical protein U9N38_01540 [Thermodesulfobacteriota bacterium]|nr:hypothetical protein [Thermodesulfobacteriota bacterium]